MERLRVCHCWYEPSHAVIYFYAVIKNAAASFFLYCHTARLTEGTAHWNGVSGNGPSTRHQPSRTAHSVASDCVLSLRSTDRQTDDGPTWWCCTVGLSI